MDRDLARGRRLAGAGLCRDLRRRPLRPGAAGGQVVFTADTAEAWNAKSKKVVLVRIETSPEDVHGLMCMVRDEVARRTGLPVELEDERLTSVQAQRTLLQTRPGRARKRRGKELGAGNTAIPGGLAAGNK